MIVTGSATARSFAARDNIRYVDTLYERFTYYIAGTASQRHRSA